MKKIIIGAMLAASLFQPVSSEAACASDFTKASYMEPANDVIDEFDGTLVADVAGVMEEERQSGYSHVKYYANENDVEKAKAESGGKVVLISLVFGCVMSGIIIYNMVRGMNTAREAANANMYYDERDVRLSVKTDRFTHTTRNVRKKENNKR